MSFQFDTFAAEYHEAEKLFFHRVLDVILRFKTSLYAGSLGLRAKLKDEHLVIEVVGFDADAEWVEWGQATLSTRTAILGDATNVLAAMNDQGHRMLRDVRRCKEMLAPTPRAGVELEKE